MLLCCFAASPRDYSRTRSPAAWAGDSSPGWHVFAHAQWRLFVARERPCQDATRNPPPLDFGCRSLRRIFEDDDTDVPVRETDAFDDSPRPHHPESEGSEATAFHVATFSRAFL